MRARPGVGSAFLGALLAATACGQGTIHWLQRWTPRGSGVWPTIQGAAVAYETTRGRVLLWGGAVAANSGLFDGTCEWQGSDWVLIDTVTRPPARHGPATTSLWPHPGVLIHGGTFTAGTLGDTWEWNGANWRIAATSGPAARGWHAMAWDAVRRRSVLFGGSATVLPMTPRADTWEWDGAQWQQANPGASPPARMQHAMAFDLPRGRVVLFGGGGGASPFSDTWEWDGSTWTQRFPVVSPPARYQHAMVFASAFRGVVVFGGLAATPLADAWLWDSPANTWVRLVPAGNAPAGRGLAGVAYDVARARLVMVGGMDWSTFRPLGDTWEALPQPPAASTTPFGLGCAGTNGAPALTAVGVPRLGNPGFALQLANARGSAAGALLCGAGQDRLSLGGGCTLHVLPPFVLLGTVTSAAGAANWPLPVANEPAWLGIDLYAQAVIADPAGAFLGLLALSNGQGLLLGN